MDCFINCIFTRCTWNIFLTQLIHLHHESQWLHSRPLDVDGVVELISSHGMGLTRVDNFSPLIECVYLYSFFSNPTASCFEVQQHFLTTLIVKNEMELSVMGWRHTQIKSTASTGKQMSPQRITAMRALQIWPSAGGLEDWVVGSFLTWHFR